MALPTVSHAKQNHGSRAPVWMLNGWPTGTDLGKQNPPERPLAGALAARHRAGDSGRRNLLIGRWGCCIVGPLRGRNTLLPWAERSLLGIGGDVAEVALAAAPGVGGNAGPLAVPTTPGVGGDVAEVALAAAPGVGGNAGPLAVPATLGDR